MDGVRIGLSVVVVALGLAATGWFAWHAWGDWRLQWHGARVQGTCGGMVHHVDDDDVRLVDIWVQFEAPDGETRTETARVYPTGPLQACNELGTPVPVYVAGERWSVGGRPGWGSLAWNAACALGSLLLVFLVVLGLRED